MIWMGIIMSYTIWIQWKCMKETGLRHMPCNTSGFDNAGGGTTNVVVMLASYMG